MATRTVKISRKLEAGATLLVAHSGPVLAIEDENLTYD
jgi:hypothetical protein